MENAVYRIRNVVNGNYYVGSTINSRKRFWEHRKLLRRGAHHCAHLQRAWAKYGESCFVFEIIEHVSSRDELFPAEQRWLDAHFGQPYCYNGTACATTPMRNATPELRARLAEKTREHARRHGWPMAGRTHTPEAKARISVSKLANPQRPWAGKTRSAETRAKISATQRGVKKGPRRYTPDGLRRAQENMLRNAKPQRPADIAAVVAKFPQAVQDRYDFSGATYLGALVRMTGIVCREHGEFSQYSAQLRKDGAGCPACGAQQRAESKRASMLEQWKDPVVRAKMIASMRNCG